MTPDDRRFHATCARRLVRACGTLEEAAKVCRLQKTRLQEFTDPLAEPPALMPVDVILELQLHCGQPIYSDALTARLDRVEECKGPADEACELTEAAAQLQAEIRRSLDHGRLKPRTKAQLTPLLLQAEHALRCMRAATDRGEP